MRKLPPPIRDNAVLAACLLAAAGINVALLWGFQESMKREVELRVSVLPKGAVPPSGAKPAEAPPPPKPPEGKKKPPEKKPEEKPPAKPPEKKKPEPKRVTTEKKPEPAKPPSKANPGDADLVPLKVDAPEPMSVDMAQLVRVQVANQGTSPASAHRDALYFSLDGKLDAKAVSLGAIEVGGALAPGEKRWERAQILLPDKTPSGRAYLVVVLNADGAMPETNHANNQLVVPIMIDANAVPLGDPNERPRTTVAWIASKDFRELKARQSPTLQPIVQNEVEAQKNAKLNNQPGLSDDKPVLGEVKPKPVEKVAEKPAEQKPKTAPVAQRKGGDPAAKDDKGEKKPDPAQKTPQPVSSPVAKKDDAQKPPAAKPVAPSRPEDKVALAPKGKGQPAPPKAAPEKPASKPTEKTADKAPEKPPEKTAGKPAADKPPAADKTAVAKGSGDSGPQEAAPKPQESPKPAAASTGEGATSAPRDASSAPATKLEESDLEQQPGRVLVGKGVKVNTARIQPPGPASLIEGVTANPRVAATFNENGEVIKAELLRSSGNFGWDHQVLLSVQRWTAEGEEVKKGGLVVRWTVLLGAGGE